MGGVVKILGIDPGAVATGFAVIDDSTSLRVDAGYLSTPALLESGTVLRNRSVPGDLIEVPRAYLGQVLSHALDLIQTHGVELIGVENVKRPAWRHRGKVKPTDPTAIMATAIVLGAILGRRWTIPIVRVVPAANGRLLPLTDYPMPLATKGKGHDARRHERSAYDVASSAKLAARLEGIRL